VLSLYRQAPNVRNEETERRKEVKELSSFSVFFCKRKSKLCQVRLGLAKMLGS
jgi:hypothetical protein